MRSGPLVKAPDPHTRSAHGQAACRHRRRARPGGSLLPRSFRSLFHASRGLRGPKIDCKVVGHPPGVPSSQGVFDPCSTLRVDYADPKSTVRSWVTAARGGAITHRNSRARRGLTAIRISLIILDGMSERGVGRVAEVPL